jgi:hypothetical protein
MLIVDSVGRKKMIPDGMRLEKAILGKLDVR